MIEQTMHAIWGKALKIDHFADDDDFFALGGHSLIMAKIQDAISEELQVEVPMDDLFRRPTVKGISAHLGTLIASQGRPTSPEIGERSELF